MGFSCGGEKVKDYIRKIFQPGTDPSKYGKINIKEVCDMPLRTLLFTITKLAGNVTLHVANISYMQYGLECFKPTMFNWAEAILIQMKEQFTNEKSGKTKNFSYGPILITFFCSKFH